MKILALDIATSTGIAVGLAGGNPVCWSEDLGKGLSDVQRFSNALALTARLLAEHKPDLVATECPIGGRTSSMLLVGLAACVRGCVANRHVDQVEYQANAIRKHFLGKALTTRSFPGLSKAQAKSAIKDAVTARCRLLGWHVPNHDAADAAALFDYAAAKAGVQVKPAGGLFLGA